MSTYSPYILGTNHNPYNVVATIAHVHSLDRTVKKIMLECYDPALRDPALAFTFDFSRGGVRLVGFKNNPSVFYGHIYRHFRSRASLCFAYSRADTISEIIANVDPQTHDSVEQVEALAQEFGRVINPLILERVDYEKPDLIIIGSSHGEYLRDNIPHSTYVHIEDNSRRALWVKRVMARAALDYIRAWLGI